MCARSKLPSFLRPQQLWFCSRLARRAIVPDHRNPCIPDTTVRISLYGGTGFYPEQIASYAGLAGRNIRHIVRRQATRVIRAGLLGLRGRSCNKAKSRGASDSVAASKAFF
jgi:hypothetical protein